MVSLILAIYNGERFLEKQLLSILNQTYTIEEVILVDDVSTDSSYQIVQDFINKYQLSNWNYIRNKKNKGFQKNFLDALLLCKGDYIFFADQDDIWHESKVADTLQIMETHPAAQEVCVGFRLINQLDNPILSERNSLNTKKIKKIIYKDFLSDPGFPGMAMAIRKSEIPLYKKIFDMNLIAHDWAISIINSATGHMYYYDKVLLDYRMHDKNTIGFSKNMQTRDYRITQIEKHIRHLNQAQQILERLDNPKLKRKIRYTARREQLYGFRLSFLSERKVMQFIKILLYLPYYPSIRIFLADVYYALKERR